MKSSKTTDNLRKVLRVNSQINSTLDIGELLTVIMKTAEEVMNAEAASLLLLEEESRELIFRVALGDKGSQLVEKFRVKLGEGIAGFVAQSGESVRVNDTRKDKRFALRFDQETGFISKSILCVPMKAKGKIIGVLEALNPIGRKAFSQNDLELFEIFSDQAAISVENAKLHAEIIRQEKAKQELKIAREIQQNFLPDFGKANFKIDIGGQNIPAREVSGDFYDVLELSPDKTGILIADVSGKGVPAALFMVNAISHFRFLAPRFPSPAELFRALNNVLAKDTARGMFITALYLTVDIHQKILEYASAGHHPILKRAVSGDIQELSHTAGLPLGLAPDAEYPQEKISLSEEDVFFLYTDGITEARNKTKEEYTLRRLKMCIASRHPNALEYTRAVFRDLECFTQGADQHDDMTVLAIRIPPF